MHRNTGCPTRYRTRQFFNNSNTNEDIATKFEQEYVRCVRNEEECVCSRCNILISGKIIKEIPGTVASGTSCLMIVLFNNLMQKFFVLIHLLHSSTCFEQCCAHLQKDHCVSTASGIVTVFG